MRRAINTAVQFFAAQSLFFSVARILLRLSAIALRSNAVVDKKIVVFTGSGDKQTCCWLATCASNRFFTLTTTTLVCESVLT